MRRLLSLVAVALFASVVAVGVAGASADAVPTVTVTPVLTNLSNPRGLAFDGLGSLYVAEAGQYQTSAASGHSTTGKVSKWSNVLATPAADWSDSFSSLWDSEHGPEVLGPGGVAATGSGCWKNDNSTSNGKGKGKGKGNGKRNGCQAYVIMNESQRGVGSVPQIGHLFRFDRNGVATDVSNVGDQMYQWTIDHHSLAPDDFPDSNPYGVTITSGKHVFVTDAGANTVSEMMKDGTARVIAYIPNETAVPFKDATPTCAAEGPDGALYVGTLDFVANRFVLGPGQSRVYRVDPNSKEDPIAAGSHLWASGGLTTLTSCTFDGNGNFLATEMFQPTGGSPPGDIVRIPWTSATTHGAVQHLGGPGQFPLPGGIAVAPDGSVFVSVFSTSAVPGSGKVVRAIISG